MNKKYIFTVLFFMAVNNFAIFSAWGDWAHYSTKEKVGQLFFLAFQNGENEDSHYTLTEGDKALLSEIKPSGVVIFSENIESAEQLTNFISDIKECDKNLLFVAIDQEGGRVQRIKYPMARTIPEMSRLGGDGSIKKAYNIGRALAKDIKKYGFNMDFAPVCDVYSNPLNTVIGDRAFSRNPKVVSRLSIAVYNGILDEGLIPVIKHFPGHGDTAADTHKTSAYSNKSLEDLKKCELIPFKDNIDNGARAVMVAHITLNKVDALPATLSYKIISELLRGTLGFNGVVITDALGMKAISSKYSPGESCIMALKAGCDVLLMPNRPLEAFNAVVDAFESGELSTARLDESVKRISALNN